jgi:large subunit ribosomal protein L25
MDVELVSQLRSERGKGAARRLRSREMVPAIVYGPKMESVSVTVSSKRMEKLLRDMGEESRLLSLSIEGDGEPRTKQVLIREIQVHPSRRRFLHVDFYEVPMDHPIVVVVPVELVGESVGVKKGGTVDLVRRTVSVRCLPGEIPEKIEVDIKKLDLGGAIHVGDLAKMVPYELVDDKHLSIVNILAPEGAAKEEEEKKK